MSTWFLSFADSRFNSAKRIRKEAVDCHWFDRVIVGDESIFERWYVLKYKDRFKDRGFGFWQWKSYLIRRVMDEMEEDDVLVYADAGCTINKEGLSQFSHYKELVSKMGGVVFNQGLPEVEWTKADVFHYFGIEEDNEKVLTHGQCAGGVILLKKCADIVAFVDEWYYICHNHYNLISDEISVIPNDARFIENRHDQSILSLLALKYGLKELPDSEVYNVDENWTLMVDKPIWVTRRRDAKVGKYQLIKRWANNFLLKI